MGAQRHRRYLATGGTGGVQSGTSRGSTGYRTGYCGVPWGCRVLWGGRNAPSLPPRFLNTSTLQLETLLQHTLEKNINHTLPQVIWRFPKHQPQYIELCRIICNTKKKCVFMGKMKSRFKWKWCILEHHVSFICSIWAKQQHHCSCVALNKTVRYKQKFTGFEGNLVHHSRDKYWSRL